MLNGRIEPSGVVDGFTVDISASGSFCPKHVTLPVTAFFFSLSDDNAPSPYLVSNCLLTSSASDSNTFSSLVIITKRQARIQPD